MIFPWQLSLSLARYVAGNKLRGRQRYPLVLMLEPTFACNLACAGCGRIREDVDIAHRMLSVQECLSAVDDAGAPVVSIAGGEPLLHPEIGAIVERIVQMKRFIYLCTNGIAMARSIQKFKPGPYFSFVFHLDGLAATHDAITGRNGIFDTAIAGIKAAKEAGFQVRTNTTLFKSARPEEVVELFSLLSNLGVDGMMIAPASATRRWEGISSSHVRRPSRRSGQFTSDSAGSDSITAPCTSSFWPVGEICSALRGARQPGTPRAGSNPVPAGRWLLRLLSEVDGRDPVGAVRSRPRPALRQLHGAQRLRGERHGRGGEKPAGHVEHG